ncbi:MAG: cellulase family glycosylhydrolase [Mariprofundus sp.]|nr:cellulase family glycosylhydrolase [Mariprofundus sp.]
MRLFLLLIFLFVCQMPTQAADMPAGWPWHGVSLDNLSSSPADIEKFQQELGINVVRLQLKPVKLAKRKKITADLAWSESIAWLDLMLDECSRLKVKGIVNLSHFPFDAKYPQIQVAQYTPEFWSDQEQLNGVVQTVTTLMKDLRKRGGEFAAIDIMSEPAVQHGKDLLIPMNWHELMRKVIASIRSERPDVWIFVSPPPLGAPPAYSGFEPFSDKFIIYNAHMYIPYSFAAQGIGRKKFGIKYPGKISGKVWNVDELKKVVEPLRDFQIRNDVPVMIGEFSAIRWADGGGQYVKDLASIFDEYGWSWIYFSGTGWHGWNPDYNQHYSGQDKTGNWQKDYVGDHSERWKTLREIFAVKQKSVAP